MTDIRDNIPQNSQQNTNNNPLGQINFNSTSKVEKVMPELLKRRLSSRKGARVFFILCALFNILLCVLGGYYFDCYYYTRKYISNGDDFWQFYLDRNLSNKAIPLNAMLTGVISILTFSFNTMNLIVIGLYVIFGGVRDRLKFANFVHLFIQVFLMIYSIFPIALYSSIVYLNIFLIVFAILNLMLAIILFIYLKRCGSCEREKMLPISIMKIHAKEYTEEYNNKLKEVMNGEVPSQQNIGS